MHKTATSCLLAGFAFMVALLGLATTAGRSSATPVSPAFVITNTDWTSAAVGGIGGGNGIGGTGTIVLGGVTGPVKKAYLYWHGIDNFSLRSSVSADDGAMSGSSRSTVGQQTPAGGCDGVYNVPTILLNGNPVTGVALGDATTNCWGVGSSRAFRADVTALVLGNGLYTLSSMTAEPCDDVNGASLIVAFDDGVATNNRDIVFFEGNDSNIADAFPGETDGWHAALPGIAFTAGTTSVQLHLADGQNFVGTGLDDNTLTFAAGGPPVVVPDGLGIYDGSSTPNAGFSRSEAGGTPGSLWDVQTFDITGVFGPPGTYTLTLDGQDPFFDCTGLVLAIVNLEAGSAPVAVTPSSWGKLKAAYR
jgi:hypothetical protein